VTQCPPFCDRTGIAFSSILPMATNRRMFTSSKETEAKVWLSDGAVALNLGFSARDLREIVRKTREQRDAFLEAWNDYFADRG
jgi:hypothetical protein